MTPGDQTPPVVLPRWLLVLLGTAATTITIAGLMGSADLIGPVFLALVLTIAAHPLRGWLLRRRVPGWLATLLMALVVYVFLFLFGLALLLATAEFASLLPTYKEQMTTAVADATSWLTRLGVNEAEIEKIASSFDVGKLAELAGEILGGLLGLIGDLFFVVTLLLFLAVDGAWFPDRLDETADARGPLVTALSSFAAGTRHYLVVSTVFGLIVAVIDTGLLWWMGIPAPLLWGLLAFITNYIPNIGFVIGLIPVAVLGFLEGGLGLMLSVIAVYSVVNVVIQSVIQPKVVGDQVGLSASLSFLSLVFWAWVLGAVGALLAIPLSLFVKALLVDIDPATTWLRPLIGDPTEPAPAAPSEVPS
ncbi:MAG: AI-2E family transporter [Nocardioides sp.]